MSVHLEMAELPWIGKMTLSTADGLGGSIAKLNIVKEKERKFRLVI